jgi:integration host factor subunit beta
LDLFPGKERMVLRTELIDRVAIANPHLRLREIEMVVRTFFEEITAALARGDRVELRGIGTFSVRARRGRSVRNLRSGVAIIVPEKRVPYFKPGKRMQERLNGGSAD